MFFSLPSLGIPGAHASDPIPLPARGMFRKFDFLPRTTDAVMGPINPGISGTLHRVRAVWIDPTSEMDSIVVVSPTLATKYADTETPFTARMSGFNTPGTTARLQPWDRAINAFAANGGGVLVSPGSPLIDDLDGSLYVVPARTCGFTNAAANVVLTARTSFCVAWDEVPGILPRGRSRLDGWGISDGSNATVIVAPVMGRRTWNVAIVNGSAATMNISVTAYSTTGNNQATKLSSGFSIPSGNGQDILTNLDFFPDGYIGDWIEVSAQGAGGAGVYIKVEALD